jgi:hypothetical protein
MGKFRSNDEVYAVLRPGHPILFLGRTATNFSVFTFFNYPKHCCFEFDNFSSASVCFLRLSLHGNMAEGGKSLQVLRSLLGG